ncbi:MAG: virulence RhuM family protein [Actinomycetes bacterium]|jgi:hypothetical protein|nr:virulence RhuM family protein [Actinomycetes bacterium]
MTQLSGTDQNEIVLYQPDGDTKLSVLIENETVWLTQIQIAALFGVKVPAISKHLKNIFLAGELNEEAVVSILETTASDGKRYQAKHYNLDAIISVGYRVNSVNATQFRIWATGVLRDYLLRGYAVHDRFERLERRVGDVEDRVDHIKGQVDFFVRTSLPPVEGIFYEGQIFDAWEFVTKLVVGARTRIVLVDNYVDTDVLALLSKRGEHVPATIYTGTLGPGLQADIAKHNEQYPPIEVTRVSGIHDRFLVIDDRLYHLGASVKDLGKKLFAFSLMEMPPGAILDRCRKAQ